MVLISAYLVIAPIYEAPLESLFCVLFLLSGIPLYLIFVRYKKVPVNFLRFVGKFVLRLLLFSILSDHWGGKTSDVV